MEKEELIQKQLEQTQASLSDKLEKLQDKVIGTAEGATDAVSDTVQAIKSTVEDTTSAVKETVTTVKDTVTGTVQEGVDVMKDLVNIPLQVQRNPWLMVGGSFAAGFLIGRTLGGSEVTSETEEPRSKGHGGNGAHRKRSPGLLASLVDQIKPELNQLRTIGLAMLASALKDSVAKAVPDEFKPQVNEIFDRITNKLTGEREHHRKGHRNGHAKEGDEARSHKRRFDHN